MLKKLLTPYTLHLTLYALRLTRFTHMNQRDQFNVKCGDLTPDFVNAQLAALLLDR